MLFIFISRFITVKSHGPAVTLQITNRYNGTAYTIDLTLAFRGGRKGGPKTAKPHRNAPKNRKPHRIFSRIPKPRVHVGHNMKADVSKTCDIF